MTITCSALLFVPGKVVIGIVEPEEQEVEDKVPHLPLLLNDFQHRAQISNFVRSACLSRGPFSTIVHTLQTGGKIADKKRFSTGNVFISRDQPPVSAHLIVLEEPFQITGLTEILY